MNEESNPDNGNDFEDEIDREGEAKELRRQTVILSEKFSMKKDKPQGLSTGEDEDDSSFFDDDNEDEDERDLNEDDLLSAVPLEEFSRIKKMFSDFDESHLDYALIAVRNYFFSRLYQINILLMRYDNLLDLYQPPLDGRIRLVERFNNESGKKNKRNIVRNPVVWKYKETQRKWYPTWLPVERLSRRVSQKPEFAKNYFHVSDMLKDVMILLRLHGRIAKRLAEVSNNIRHMDSWMKEMDEVLESYEEFVSYAKREKLEELRIANRKRLAERKRRMEELDDKYRTPKPKRKFINRTRQEARAKAKAKAKAGQGK